MKPRPTIDVDRDAQIVALWNGRAIERRRPGDVDTFCQWLIDYVPWLVPAGAEPLEQIRMLIQSHSREGDDRSDDRRPPIVTKQR